MNKKMFEQNRRITLFMLVFCTLLGTQSIQAAENLDSLFIEARTAAMDTSSRDLAIEMCELALSIQPEYHDFRILLGRCHSWNGNFSRAEKELKQVVEALESYQDARNALLDVHIWSGQDEKALTLLDKSIMMYPNEAGYRVKKLRILIKMEREYEALDVAENILELEPENEEALNFKTRVARIEELSDANAQSQVAQSKAMSSTTLRYAYNRLAATNTQWQFLVVEPSMDPWHWLSVEHKESFAFGPVIFKLNYANRFQNTGTQFEIESYPTIRKGTYLYTGMGLSNSDLFPSFRVGMEVFQALPKDFEASLGFRYLEVPDKQIPIYVGTLGKYWQSYWISAKTYISPSNSSLSRSWVLGVRKYLANPRDFIDAYIGSGISPDVNLGGEEIRFLGSRSFGVSLKKEVGSIYDLNIGLRFSNLETREDAFRGDTGLDLALTRKF